MINRCRITDVSWGSHWQSRTNGPSSAVASDFQRFEMLATVDFNPFKITVGTGSADLF